MTHILLKLENHDVVFGEFKERTVDGFVIIKPHAFFYKDNELSIAPYDATVIQGEMKEVTINKDKVIFHTDLKDMPHILDAYRQAVTGIVLPSNKIIS